MNQIPGSPMNTLAMYYMIKTPLKDHPLLYNFVNGDDAYRNSRFKIIPYISKVSNYLIYSIKSILAAFQISYLACFLLYVLPNNLPLQGSWIVKQSVGKRACLLSQALETHYFHGKNYLEVDFPNQQN